MFNGTEMEVKRVRCENLQQVGAMALAISEFDKPVIGAINGVAVGAGIF